MITSDRLLKFAAECEVMAKFTRSREDRVAWSEIAQRWLRCAELMEQQDSDGPRRKKAAKSVRTLS
jgi:hypothetical protein